MVAVTSRILIRPVSVGTRTDRHSLQPSHGCGEVDETSEVNGASIIAGSETAKVLEAVEATLDAIAAFMEVSIVRDDDFARPV